MSCRARLATLDLKAVAAAAVFVVLDAHVQLLKRLVFIILICTAPHETVLVLHDLITFPLILVRLDLVVASLVVAPCVSNSHADLPPLDGNPILKTFLKLTYFDWLEVK